MPITRLEMWVVERYITEIGSGFVPLDMSLEQLHKADYSATVLITLTEILGLEANSPIFHSHQNTY